MSNINTSIWSDDRVYLNGENTYKESPLVSALIDEGKLEYNTHWDNSFYAWTAGNEDFITASKIVFNDPTNIDDFDITDIPYTPYISLGHYDSSYIASSYMWPCYDNACSNQAAPLYSEKITQHNQDRLRYIRIVTDYNYQNYGFTPHVTISGTSKTNGNRVTLKQLQPLTYLDRDSMWDLDNELYANYTDICITAIVLNNISDTSAGAENKLGIISFTDIDELQFIHGHNTTYGIFQELEFRTSGSGDNAIIRLNSPVATDGCGFDKNTFYSLNKKWLTIYKHGSYLKMGLKLDRNIVFTFLSSFGFKFTMGTGTTSLDNTDIIVPEILDNKTTGKWFTYDRLDDAVSDNLHYTDVKDIVTKPPKDQAGDDRTDNITIGGYNSTTGSIQYFAMTDGQMASFMSWLENTEMPAGADPMQNIISLAVQPISIAPLHYTSVNSIFFSQIEYTGSDVASTFSPKTSTTFLGSITVPRLNNNFLDYDPYTKVSVYIALCGEIDLPTNLVMGRTINVQVICDIPSGNLRGVVMCDIKGNECIVGSIGGTFTHDIPISAECYGMRKSAEIQSLVSVSRGVASGLLGAGYQSPSRAISGGLTAGSEAANYYIEQNANFTECKGSVSDVINFNMPKQCYLKISYPSANIPFNFGHVHGYKCNTTKKLSECSGYTVCSNVDTSGISEATDQERAEIKQALETGIYL